MADEDPYGGDDGGGGGGGNFDFSDVDFSGEQLRGILNSVQTQAEHWLSQDAVFALNEAIKGKTRERNQYEEEEEGEEEEASRNKKKRFL